MTGYTVHTGTSKKFISGWDKVFGNGQAEKSDGKSTAKAKSTSGKAKKTKKK